MKWIMSDLRQQQRERGDVSVGENEEGGGRWICL